MRRLIFDLSFLMLLAWLAATYYSSPEDMRQVAEHWISRAQQLIS